METIQLGDGVWAVVDELKDDVVLATIAGAGPPTKLEAE
jgi:hypothetical protein